MELNSSSPFSLVSGVLLCLQTAVHSTDKTEATRPLGPAHGSHQATVLRHSWSVGYLEPRVFKVDRAWKPEPSVAGGVLGGPPASGECHVAHEIKWLWSFPQLTLKGC